MTAIQDQDKHNQFQALPGVDTLLEKASSDSRFHGVSRTVVVSSIRRILDELRKKISQDLPVDISHDHILDQAAGLGRKRESFKLVPVINATGVILHTNLGRSPLCAKVLDNILAVARGYSNLEFDLATGKRGLRYRAVEEILCELTGASAAIAVNNNAGAVLLALNTLAQDCKVVVSRGELVEIGGSFRIPDVMEKSGCILKEVGTTNRTHLKDYAAAVSENTGLLLKVHTSNYKIQGFTKSVSTGELAALGKENAIPVMVDLGSGTLMDFSAHGLPAEPRVSDEIAAGADIVTFSGDKLLGGPQAGIIAGNTELIQKIQGNPLTRALRIDKLTLAAQEATLSLYRDKDLAVKELPALRMLTMSSEETRERAKSLAGELGKIKEQKRPESFLDLAVSQTFSRPGGGSFPDLVLPGFCVSMRIPGISVSELDQQMRKSSPAVIGRIEEDRYIMDPRTLDTGQETIIAKTIEDILRSL